MNVQETIAALKAFKSANPRAKKTDVEAYFQSLTKANKIGSVYRDTDWAFRFCEANVAAFSNTISALSVLKKHDSVPFVICIVRLDGLDFRLANTTFLRKISHSSQNFTNTHIRGSFNAGDIMRDFEKIPNQPNQFGNLFELHAQLSWNENVKRLAAATNAIVPRLPKLHYAPEIEAAILAAPSRALALEKRPSYADAEKKLYDNIATNKADILNAAALDNAKIRGDTIEKIITGAAGAHRLDDVILQIGNTRLLIDIKTKRLDLASAPKAYNIEKVLALLAQTDTVFSLLFIGLDPSKNLVTPRLISLFDPLILSATNVRHHWAGKGSRGVTQFSGDLSSIFHPSYKPSVDVERGKSLLTLLMER
jgi:hypothetical protein